MREITENPGNRMMYYLADGAEQAFVLEELMLIPEDTELPPDYVQEWYSGRLGPGSDLKISRFDELEIL